MAGENLSIAVAFMAGLISFIAPCVLPLIPGYLAFLASGAEGEKPKRKEIFLSSVFFVLGFSFVFALLGVLLNTLLSNVAYDVQSWLSRIGGVIIILFGLYLTGLIKPKFLQKEYKFHPTKKFKSKYFTAFVFGSAFAVGWSPCVGAVLGSVLALAATQPSSAFALLFSYSLGLGLPFLVLGLFTAELKKYIQNFKKTTKVINILFGAFLIVFGILIFTQQLSRIANFEYIINLLS